MGYWNKEKWLRCFALDTFYLANVSKCCWIVISHLGSTDRHFREPFFVPRANSDGSQMRKGCHQVLCETCQIHSGLCLLNIANDWKVYNDNGLIQTDFPVIPVLLDSKMPTMPNRSTVLMWLPLTSSCSLTWKLPWKGMNSEDLTNSKRLPQRIRDILEKATLTLSMNNGISK